jgi:urease accessory protein
MLGAWQTKDAEQLESLDADFVAGRETAELRAETLQMGYSLVKLLGDLDVSTAALDAMEEIAYPTAFAFAVAAWNLSARDAVATYMFAWIENQVLAAVKCVPLGQTDGQRLMLRLGERIAPLADAAFAFEDGDLANFAPGLAILSARHETQYSRLFRS